VPNPSVPSVPRFGSRHQCPPAHRRYGLPMPSTVKAGAAVVIRRPAIDYQWLARRSTYCAVREGAPELTARGDPELREDLAQVPFDRAGADVELATGTRSCVELTAPPWRRSCMRRSPSRAVRTEAPSITTGPSGVPRCSWTTSDGSTSKCSGHTPDPGRALSLTSAARPALEAHTGGIRRAPRATRRSTDPAEARCSLGS